MDPRPEVHRAVDNFFSKSKSFKKLPATRQRQIVHDTVQIVDYLGGPGAGGSPIKRKTDRMGNLLESVDFPQFVNSLIDGVFKSIVQSSVEQMEAYAQLVSDITKSLDQFRDENVSDEQARDYLAKTFGIPELEPD